MMIFPLHGRTGHITNPKQWTIKKANHSKLPYTLYCLTHFDPPNMGFSNDPNGLGSARCYAQVPSRQCHPNVHQCQKYRPRRYSDCPLSTNNQRRPKPNKSGCWMLVVLVVSGAWWFWCFWWLAVTSYELFWIEKGMDILDEIRHHEGIWFGEIGSWCWISTLFPLTL